MRIHHLNCATLHPFGKHLVCHCLLIETAAGLVLVDTGLGLKDILRPTERFNRWAKIIFNPKLDIQETAYRQIRKLGFCPSDVRHIILTHLDFDHAGGIDDFPDAQVHLMDTELEAATNLNCFQSRFRYCPEQLTQSGSWHTYYAEGGKWFGLDAVKLSEGLPPEILLIPLAGHSPGHAGVAVNTDQGWLLHAGDTYYYRGELNNDYHCPFGLRSFQKIIQVNHKLHSLNLLKLKDLARSHHDVRIFCSHDPVEFADLKNSPPRLLAGTSETFNHVIWATRDSQHPESLN